MPGHTDKKMGSGGMDIPAISREEQVMRDLPKGDVTTTDEELKKLNPNMDFRTADEMEADKARTLQSDMMMLQNLIKNASPTEAQELMKVMDMVGAGFTVQEVFDVLKSFDPKSVVRQGEMPTRMMNPRTGDSVMSMDMGKSMESGMIPMPMPTTRQGEMIGRNPMDEMMREPMSEQALRGALGGIGAVPTSRNMGDAT